ncbi:O-methylsterigmatocystin oxidoreductase [Rhizoctonia solani]|uniref:O-methylsterigmatocystin oxidoreductase n=1 Tax=Rhizoctonia solani TaxID=456999 RepID=A0A0K6FQA7_9AGAM|nr:O-methylsterigmatocystin oxidoreductase [Rhizoctonia solani]
MVALADYTDNTKAIRRYMHSSMSAKAMPDWQPQQEQEAFRFLQRLLRSPEGFLSHIRHTAGATVVRLTYGYTPKDKDDEYIKTAEVVMDNFSSATTPGAFMVDVLPALRYIPWAPFKRTAREWSDKLSELIKVPMDFVHDQMKKGVVEPSFVAKWLEEPGRANEKAMIPEAAVSLYTGGADTTVSAISTFFVAILHYPEAQKLAQKEIDEVLGKDRLPTFADRSSLPYVEALYKEVMRWQPIAPIGVPHRLGSESDDEYKGMRIPANAMVIANIWGMLRDPKVYQHPETFNPSRFLGADPEPDPEDVVFGFGRRRCPGMAVAQTSVWLSIALTLAAFNVTPLTGEDGKPTLPSLEYSHATVTHPQPFQCNIVPRSEKLKETIEEISL